MQAESAKRKMSLGFLQVCEDEALLVKLLSQRGFHRTLDLPLAYLDISWDHFDGYKNYIRGKKLKWKRNIVQDMNKSRRSGVKIDTVGEDFCKQENQMMELLNRNYVKHNQVELPYHNNILSRLKMNLKDGVEIYRAGKNGRMTGLSVMLKRNATWSFILVGIDHVFAQNDATYFNIIFYRPIMDAIAAKIKRIDYGNGLYDVKIHRGCNIMKTYAFYKTHHPISNFVVKFWFYFHRFWYQNKFNLKRMPNGK